MVDAFNTSTSMKVKCMPNSYPAAVATVNTLYKSFTHMYLD